MMIRGYTIAARTLALIAGIIALVVLAVWVPSCLRDAKTAKKQAEVSQGQAGAAIDAGAEATNTMGNIMDLGRETDQAVKEGKDAIRAAPEAERGARTVDASCRLRAYRDSERCARLRAADSRKPPPAR